MLKESDINIAVISNFTVEPILGKNLNSIFSRAMCKVNLQSISYDEYSTEENLNIIHYSDRIIVWLNIDCFYPDLINDLISKKVSTEEIVNDAKIKFLNLYSTLRHNSQVPILWMGVEDYCYYHYNHSFGNLLICEGVIDRVNFEVISILNDQDTYFDLKSIIARISVDLTYDNKSKYRWNIPYSRELFLEISKEIYKQYLVDNGISKKCLVVDCDNVLWGGILSEDGIENIQLGSSGLGRSFQDFQRFILTLYYCGVIIAICSKNDITDVFRMFREHDEMVLKEEHIACFCVNWDNKSDNIIKISEDLNIGLDSMVFVDDSDFEIQSIHTFLPEVTAIKYDRDTIYEELSCFNLSINIDIENVMHRNCTYQTNRFRKLLKSESSSFDKYLSSLEMKVDIHKILPIELSRVAELTQRTNKCTNGRRYTVDQLKQKQKSGYMLYSVSLADKFSNLGIVGAIGIEGNTLDLFSLSCRALGRKVEELMINFIREKNLMYFHFNSSEKNNELRLMLNNLLKEKTL